MKVKNCAQCKKTRLIKFFYKAKDTRTGFTRCCKECDLKRLKESHKANPSNQRIRDYKKRFGDTFTLPMFKQMEKEQNNLCAICFREERAHHQSGTLKKLAVDHDHMTGKIRGLLCSACNTAIGKLRDNVEVLKSAINYLEKYK